MNIEELIEMLQDITTYDEVFKTHYMGVTILTNKDMRTICSHYFQDEYDSKSPREQRLIRERIFKELM